MITPIHDWLTSLATWPIVSLLLVGFLACQQGFDWRQKKLAYTSTPDVRGWYSPDDIRDLFGKWGSDRLSLYAWTEVTLDLVFPPVYGLLFATLTAQLFPTGPWGWLVIVPLAGAVADLSENVTMASLAWTFDDQKSPAVWAVAVRAAACFTAVKIACFVASCLILLAGGVAGLGHSPTLPMPAS